MDGLGARGGVEGVGGVGVGVFLGQVGSQNNQNNHSVILPYSVVRLRGYPEGETLSCLSSCFLRAGAGGRTPRLKNFKENTSV